MYWGLKTQKAPGGGRTHSLCHRYMGRVGCWREWHIANPQCQVLYIAQNVCPDQGPPSFKLQQGLHMCVGSKLPHWHPEVFPASHFVLARGGFSERSDCGQVQEKEDVTEASIPLQRSSREVKERGQLASPKVPSSTEIKYPNY